MVDQIEEAQRKMIPILERHDVIRAGLFGSLVTDRLAEDSDIDILVELRPDKSLLDLIALKLDLEDALGRSVDLIEYPLIHPRLNQRILQEEVRVL